MQSTQCLQSWSVCRIDNFISPEKDGSLHLARALPVIANTSQNDNQTPGFGPCKWDRTILSALIHAFCDEGDL